MTLSEKTPMHVLIVGAGITGLLLAQSLKMAGIPYNIFEAEQSAALFRPREWSLGIHWSLPHLKKCLPENLWERLAEAQNDPNYVATKDDTMEIYHGETGEVLASLPSVGMRRFSRRKLRALCAEGIDIQYDKALKSIIWEQGTVTAHFEDGTTSSGMLLLGADGPSSAVRSLLLGPAGKSIPMEITHSVIHVCYNDAVKARHIRSTIPVSAVALSPSGMCNFIAIQDAAEADKPETWVFFLALTVLGHPDGGLDSAARLKTLKEKVQGLAEPWKSAWLWVPEGTKVSADKISYWPTALWDNHQGTVSLVGDAAHPLSPHRGQGLNNCIADVAKVVECLKAFNEDKLGLQEAIDEYEKEMIPRGAQEVMASRGNTLALLNWEQMMESPLMKRGLMGGTS